MTQVNGKAGVRWITLVPIAVLVVGGGITWGENRLTTAMNVADIKKLEQAHSKDVDALRDNQEQIDDKLTEVIIQQAVTKEQIDAIRRSQESQEDMTKKILKALQTE